MTESLGLRSLFRDVAADRRFRIWAGVAIVLHLGAAVFTVGYHHPDEHYQVLEFASYKLGGNDEAGLSWEFPRRMRSGLQPAIAWLVVRAGGAVGLDSPHTISLLLRLLSTALAGACVAALAWGFAHELGDRRRLRAFLLLSGLVWFMPYLHARFSAEGWSGSLFWIGLALIVGGRARSLPPAPMMAAAGALFGLAFQCRYQTAVLALGVGLWLLIEARARIADLAVLTGAFTATVGLGVVVDRWLYGEWVFAPWRYVDGNAIEGLAGQFDTHPVWYYPMLTLLGAVPPLSVLVLGAAVAFWVLAPRHPVTWSSLLFVLAHSVPARKSLRFLFPMLPVLPLMAVFAVLAIGTGQGRAARWLRGRRWRPGRKTIGFSVGLNLMQLAFVSFAPATVEVVVQKQIYDHADGKPVTVVGVGCDPFATHEDYPQTFYRPGGLRVVRVEDFAAVTSVVNREGRVLVVAERFDIPTDDVGYSTRLVYRSLPGWARHVNVNDWLERSPPWLLFEASPIPTELGDTLAR
ncbi:MAG: hypothetical protein VYE73_16070 [Acidobacteriota bacterium]|nr:hypothetical protein [Acidobacteriota bacterium]